MKRTHPVQEMGFRAENNSIIIFMPTKPVALILAFLLIASRSAAPAPPARNLYRENSRLLVSAAAGSLDGVRRALRDGANPDAVDEFGDHALNLAADAGSVNVCQALINAGADIDAFGSRDRTALMSGAEAGAAPLVSMLLLHKAPVNTLTSLGETALLLAARAGSGPCVISLLNAGARPGIADSAGETPLLAAIRSWPPEAPLAGFAFLASRSDMNAADPGGRTPLMSAALRERPDLISILLARGAKANARDRDGRTALLYAVQGSGAAVGAREASAMLFALSPVREQDGPTALALAAACGNAGAIRGLFAEGVSVNSPCPRKIERLFLSAPSPARDLSDAPTPLMLVVAFGRPAAIDLLIGFHANAGARDGHGRTAIMYAARCGQIECARRLIVRGVDVDAADLDGLRPLMHAALSPQQAEAAAIVRLLVGAGADPGAKDPRGRTASDIARETGNDAVLQALTESAATHG